MHDPGSVQSPPGPSPACRVGGVAAVIGMTGALRLGDSWASPTGGDDERGRGVPRPRGMSASAVCGLKGEGEGRVGEAEGGGVADLGVGDDGDVLRLEDADAEVAGLEEVAGEE